VAYTQEGENMETTEFSVKPHGTLPGNQMAEFWRDGVFVAGIYPHEDGLRIVSKYMDGVEVEREQGYPPGVVVRLSKT